MTVPRFDPRDSRPLTRVAVAIIERVVDGEYQVLFAQRPVGKAYAGYWEFPGGKIETGESAIDALIREIDEELGLHIHSATLWLLERFSYEHAHVELLYFRVDGWDGDVECREGQQISWQPADCVSVSPLMPALCRSGANLIRANELPHASKHCLER